jgi:hypothetical protein
LSRAFSAFLSSDVALATVRSEPVILAGQEYGRWAESVAGVVDGTRRARSTLGLVII